jgi:hypothetical protein
MSTHQVRTAFALATALAVPRPSHADPNPDRAPCFLDADRVVSVKPYYGTSGLGRAELQPLRGAEVELAPAIWLSSARLEGQIVRLLQTPRREPLPECLTGVGHIHIESDPLGNASSVRLIARDPNDADRVFRRARRLVGG